MLTDAALPRHHRVEAVFRHVGRIGLVGVLSHLGIEHVGAVEEFGICRASGGVKTTDTRLGGEICFGRVTVATCARKATAAV